MIRPTSLTRDDDGQYRATAPQRDESGGSSGGALRKAALALGVIGLAWVVSRRVQPDDLPTSTDAVREKAGEVADRGRSIDIRDKSEGGDEQVEAVAEEREGDEATMADPEIGRQDETDVERDDDAETLGAETDDETAGDETDAGSESGAETGDEDLPGGDIEDEELAERAEDGAHEEPAPPGEMAVDEEVLEEVDEGGEGGEDLDTGATFQEGEDEVPTDEEATDEEATEAESDGEAGDDES